MDPADRTDVHLKTVREKLNDLAVLKWALPIFLAVTAIAFELVEHLQKDELLDPAFMGEMIIFGFMGPLIIRGLLVWMFDLTQAQRQATTDILVFNRDLEKVVNERTAALEQRNAELNRLNAELRDLDEMKSDFVALVSHELRAPLTALNGGLELALQSSENLPPRSRAILEIMQSESNRLTDFIQTILNVSRLEAGKISINLGPVAVRPLMEQAAEIVLAAGQRQVEWNLTPNLPPIWGDETFLETVVRNLISNADKYSPPDKPLHFCADANENTIRLSVKDHGPGINPEFSDRIFTHFSRLHSGENFPQGWGLGLYLAKKLVEAQKGQIGFVSPIWKNDVAAPGAEFFIILPIAQSPEDDLE